MERKFQSLGYIGQRIGKTAMQIEIHPGRARGRAFTTNYSPSHPVKEIGIRIDKIIVVGVKQANAAQEKSQCSQPSKTKIQPPR
jgi:hypothetical protein